MTTVVLVLDAGGHGRRTGRPRPLTDLGRGQRVGQPVRPQGEAAAGGQRDLHRVDPDVLPQCAVVGSATSSSSGSSSRSGSASMGSAAASAALSVAVSVVRLLSSNSVSGSSASGRWGDWRATLTSVCAQGLRHPIRGGPVGWVTLRTYPSGRLDGAGAGTPLANPPSISSLATYEGPGAARPPRRAPALGAREGSLHGYAIIEALKARSGGALNLPTGTVYPALRRLERAGYVDSTWSTVNGRERRTYQLTGAGHRALASERTSLAGAQHDGGPLPRCGGPSEAPA